MKKNHEVAHVIGQTVKAQALISLGIAVTVIGAVASSLLPPLVLADIIDRLAQKQPISFGLALSYLLLLALAGVLESARESLLTIFGQKMTHALRTRLSQKLTALSADVLTGQEAGAVVSRFVSDVDTVENLFTSGIISMFADTCRIISIFVVIWSKNPGLAFVLLVVLPFIFLFTRIIQKRMLAAELANRAAVGRVTSQVPETIRCIRTIHTLGKERWMEKRYAEVIGESYAAIEKTNFYDAVYSPVILIFNAITVSAVMLLSASGNPAVLSWFGMSVGTAVAVINYIAQIFTPLESLGMEIQTIQSAIAGVRRVNLFLAQEEREIPKTSNAADSLEGAKSAGRAGNGKVKAADNGSGRAASLSEATGTQPEICVDFSDVTFGYDERQVLKDLSFAVKTGEHVTLQGRTGAGKSTIFKLLLGLYRPQSGSVRINGIPADRISDQERRKIFGYVEQSFHMIPGTVRDQITLGDARISAKQAEEAARLTGLHEAISQLEHGYDTPCTSSMFSQGQWQLLSIARAVAAQPQILLLDEITANLDAETEQAVLKALANVSEQRTVISISHRVYSERENRSIHIG